MKKIYSGFILLGILLLQSSIINAQNVGINATGAAPSADAILDISATDKGLLIPRVSIANLATIAPITGGTTTSLLVYNTNATTGLGYYYWDGAQWVRFLSGANVDNGLYYNAAASSIRMGGSLVENTTITQAGFSLDVNLSGTGDFSVQDAGTDIFQIRDDGLAFFGDDVYWRDVNIGGTNLMVLTDDGNDGRLRIYENGVTSVDLDANSQFIFNEQGLDRNFRIESDAQANMFLVDAGLNNIGMAVVPNANNNILTVQQATTTGTAGWFNTTANSNWPALEASAASTTQGSGVTGLGFTGVSGSTTSAGGWAGFFDYDTYIDWMFYTGATLISDRRLKNNIVEISDAMSVLNSLNPVKYNKASGAFEQNNLKNGKPYKREQSEFLEYGFIAQDVEKVLPELVKSKKMNMTSGGTMDVMGVNYTMLIPLLTKGLQEQQLLIESQNERIEKLEEQIEQLIENK